MSAYYNFHPHSAHPTPAPHNTHGGRNRRAPRLSVSQNSQRQFRQVRSIKDANESMSLAAFRIKFEAGRSFELEDDMEFCPNLLTDNDVSIPGNSTSLETPLTEFFFRSTLFPALLSGLLWPATLPSPHPPNNPKQWHLASLSTLHLLRSSLPLASIPSSPALSFINPLPPGAVTPFPSSIPLPASQCRVHQTPCHPGKCSSQ